MADVELSPETLTRFDFDPQGLRYPYSSRTAWSIPMDQTMSRATSQRMANVKRSTSPLQSYSQGYDQIMDQHAQTLISEWHIPPTSGPQLGYSLNTAFPQQYTEGLTVPYQTSPTEFIPNRPELDTSLAMENQYFPMLNPTNTTPWDTQALPNDFMDFPLNPAGLTEMNIHHQSVPENSPTDTFSDIRSLTSSSSDSGWKSFERRPPSLESSLHDGQNGGALCNPGQLQYEPTFSDSSYSDIEFPSQLSWSSYVEVPNLDQLSSPGSDSLTDRDYYHIHQYPYDQVRDQEEERDPSSSPVMITSSMVQPIDIKIPTPPQRSPVSTRRSSPPGRRSRKNTNPKATKPTIRRPSQTPKLETEKKVGRRTGPLRPDQRKQACEIRKLGACLRCRFLKKTVWIPHQKVGEPY
jgi:hypothetical protein